jgi:CHAT domain-containing protein/Tfp pilus assembly protein PilF
MHEEARPFLEEAVKVFRKVLPPGPDLAKTLDSLGWLLHELGKPVEARPLLEEALAIRRKALPPGSPDLAASLCNLSTVLVDLGQHAEARPLLEEALAIQHKALPSGHPALAASLNNLGRLLRELDKPEEARPLLEEAVGINRKALPPGDPSLARSLLNLGIVLQEMGKATEAFRHLADAVLSQAEYTERTALASAQADHAALTLLLRPLLYCCVSQAVACSGRGDDLAARVMAAVLDAKGTSAAALSARREALLLGDDAEALALHRRLQPRRQELTDLLLHGPGKLSPEQYRDRCTELRQECDEQERQVGLRSAAYAEAIRGRRASPADLAQALPARAAFVEFVKYARWDFRARQWNEPHYLALMVHRGEEEQSGPSARLVPLGEAAPLDAAIHSWRKATTRGRLDEAADRRLRELLWEPLAKALPEETTRLFVAPDGEVALVPFEAIRLEDGTFLIEKLSISYLGTGRDLMPRPRPRQQSDTALVLADPDYDALDDSKPPAKAAPVAAVLPDADRDVVFGGRPRRLPGFAREADAVEDLLRAQKGWRVEGRRDRRASEEELRSAGRPRLLWCVTHGFFLEDAPRPAAGKGFRELGLSDAGSKRWRLPDPGPDPRLRSGLVLAGANRWQERARRGQSDGLLTAREAEELDLWGTELVVLSACNTDRGYVQVGEGVLGLRRAFRLAGAESVLASLWPVPDQETERLLPDVLRRWLAGAPPAVALREAQLALIADLRKSADKRRAAAPPLLWAGFICHGSK